MTLALAGPPGMQDPADLPDMTRCFPPWLAASVAALQGHPPTIPARLAPNQDQTAFIVSELATLEHRLAPTAERDLLPVLMMLLAAFPAQSLSPDMAELRAEAYRTALGELPAWAVRAAVVAWLRGEA